MYVANIADWKNHDLLLQAFRMLQGRYEQRLRLTFVGGDPFRRVPKLVEEIAEKVAAFGGLVDVVSQTDNVYDVLKRADLMVHPAFPEPFGRVVVEALCTGLPVVAFAGRHGPAEIVERCGGGLLVSPVSGPALAEGIGCVVERLDYFRESARRASVIARTNYSSSRVAAETANLYRRLLNREP